MRSFKIFSQILIFSCCSLAAAWAQTSLAQAPKEPDHFDLNSVDTSIDPCVDFYQYSCKKWLDSNPIPGDQASWGHGAKLSLWNQSVLKDVLEKASNANASRSVVNQEIGDYYAACMDESAINAKGISALKPELDRIDALKSKMQLAGELAHLHAITTQLEPPTDSGAETALFGFTSGQDLDDASKVVASLDQGGLGLLDRDYYLNDDAKSVETRQQYVTHLQKTFELLGENSATATAHAKTVMEMETALAKASMNIVLRRDPANLNHKLSAQELRALTPDFSWDEYLKDVQAPATLHYLVASPDFFKGVNQLIKSESLDNWKTYLRWQLVSASSSLMGQPFVEEKFDFYGRKLVGQKEQRPRWRRCTQFVDRDLGEALGQAYVDQTFGAEGKARMLKMVQALEVALGTDIQQLDWMSDTTKKEALVKLKGFEGKIGYPDQWRDYSSIKIVRDDLLGDAFRSGAFELHRQMEKIGKPVDRGEWGMTPPTVNAYYDPQLNTINFPAGILQPPYFDKTKDDAVNFGSIGAVIGHEMTHGFDDEGRKFDPTGNLRDWWTEQDGKEFERRAQCIADEYSGFEATPGTKVNGKLTLGENTADNGGTRIALMALKNTLAADGKSDEKIDGFTAEQTFFIAFGQGWCDNLTPEFLRVIAQSNPHSPPQFRVNGVVSNMPEFQKAFNCKKGQPMVRDNACHVW
ncbi:MAG TPA: M13 family metallopeptidase [Terriglobales bacterium]|nr:M13 family metallopeptidase [Terriglobales bacterium]